MQTTTLGQERLKKILPSDTYALYGNKTLDKKVSKLMLAQVALKHPDKYVDVLHKLNELGGNVSEEYGREATIKLSDLVPNKAVKGIQSNMVKTVQAIEQSSSLTARQKNDRIIEYILSVQDKARKDVVNESVKTSNNLAIATKQGVKGNPLQMSQLLLGDLLVADHEGNPVPIAALTGYGDGVSPIQFWANAGSSRKGYYDVQFATAQTGFSGKKLTNAVSHVNVVEEDCGNSTVGNEYLGNEPGLIGKILASDSGKFKTGTMITHGMINDLKDKSVKVRSASTCKSENGICQKCLGKQSNNKLAPIGYHAGYDSSRALAEPLTQLGLSAKHSGGVSGVNDHHISGFTEIDQFTDVPSNFNGATVSDVSGKIKSVEKAPQGGTNVIIAGRDKPIYLPDGRDIVVEKGDYIEAGDVLNDGYANPAEITKYKGIGEGRRYFSDQYRKIFSKNNAYTDIRNTEVIAKGYIDKVRITDSDYDLDGYIIGDMMSYDKLAKMYKPRDGSALKSLKDSEGSYLESSALHYTIGSPVTPSMIKVLESNGIKEIEVHSDAPVFEPVVERPISSSAKKEDWKENMLGWGVKAGFERDVNRGSLSPKDSLVGKVMDPTRF